MTESEGKIFVEKIFEELAHTQVGPSAMDKEQTFQISKLRQGKVAGKNCLHTFLATDSDTNVSH